MAAAVTSLGAVLCLHGQHRPLRLHHPGGRYFWLWRTLPKALGCRRAAAGTALQELWTPVRLPRCSGQISRCWKRSVRSWTQSACPTQGSPAEHRPALQPQGHQRYPPNKATSMDQTHHTRINQTRGLLGYNKDQKQGRCKAKSRPKREKLHIYSVISDPLPNLAGRQH